MANQTTFNNAFVSRTDAQTSTVSKLDLENVVAASGPFVVNTQREINSLNSITGRTSGSVFNATLAWVSSFLGSATDTLFARAEALTLKFRDTVGNGGHAHTGVNGDGAQVDLGTGTSGTLAVARGGTGATTAVVAFNTLSPLGTVGELVGFDGTDNVALAVGTDGQVLTADSGEATGIKWADPTAASNTPAWIKYTVTHTALQVAALTNDIELVSLPANSFIHGARIKHSTAFSGGSISAYTISVGLSGELDRYATPFDVFQATGSTVRQSTALFEDTDAVSATSVRIAAESVGDDLDQSTTGSVDVWLLVSTLP